MRTFVDSTGLLDAPDMLRHRMAEDGYLYFPGLFDRVEVQAVAREALDTLATLRWVRPNTRLDAALPLADVPEADGVYNRGIARLQALESLHRLACTPRLVPAMEALCGPGSFRHPAHVVRVVWPLLIDPGPDSDEADWIHQDWSVQHVPDMFTAWYPLLDTPRDNGPLRVLSGGHRAGRIGRIWMQEPVGVATDDERWASTDYRAGDVVIFHCMTPHTGMLNRTQRLRMSCEVRFQAADHPMPTIGASPALVQHWRVSPEPSAIPIEWETLAKDWVSDEWYRYPESVKLFSHTDPAIADEPHPASVYR